MGGGVALRSISAVRSANRTPHPVVFVFLEREKRESFLDVVIYLHPFRWDLSVVANRVSRLAVTCGGSVPRPGGMAVGPTWQPGVTELERQS